MNSPSRCATPGRFDLVPFEEVAVVVSEDAGDLFLGVHPRLVASTIHRSPAGLVRSLCVGHVERVGWIHGTSEVDVQLRRDRAGSYTPPTALRHSGSPVLAVATVVRHQWLRFLACPERVHFKICSKLGYPNPTCTSTRLCRRPPAPIPIDPDFLVPRHPPS